MRASILLSVFSLLLTTCSSFNSFTGSISTGWSTSFSSSSSAGQAGQVPSVSEWPHEIANGSDRITLYPPQTEKWSDNQVEMRAAISVQTSASSQPTYGVVWLKAHTVTEASEDRRIRFENVQITRAEFPSQPSLAKKTTAALTRKSGELLKPVSAESLRSSLEVTQIEKRREAPVLNNTPPRIFRSQSPALLVLIDGKPVLREIPGLQDSKLLRVINTRVLLLRDSSRGNYFLHLSGGWMEAPALEGPWKKSANPPDSVERARKLAVERQDADLLDDLSTAPAVYVSTEPAELLQTRGTPEFQSIAGTRLLYVENSPDTILLDQADQNYYVLLSGRWYRARSLEGPWSSVSARNLPDDFAKIPKNHRKGEVLASVAGTPQAREAALKNEVPETAKVDRQSAQLDLHYDGAPKFEPIEGTPLRYAVNSRIPVIAVDLRSYYALHAGVWFVATAPDGPWYVATQVPAVVYSIPPSSPLYRVTFVRVYDSTPRYVVVGYTPGYLGSYYCSEGVVVFGTGYTYGSWISSWGYYPWWGPWYVGVPVYYGPHPAPTGASPATPPNLYSDWQASPPERTPPPVSAWNPSSRSGSEAGSSGWSTSPSSEAEAPRIQGYTGGSTASAPTPPPPPPPPPAPSDAHASAAGQATPGGGWGPKR